MPISIRRERICEKVWKGLSDAKDDKLSTI